MNLAWDCPFKLRVTGVLQVSPHFCSALWIITYYYIQLLCSVSFLSLYVFYAI